MTTGGKSEWPSKSAGNRAASFAHPTSLNEPQNMSRPPKSLAAKYIAGTLRQDRRNPSQLKAPLGGPIPQGNLSPAALDAWAMFSGDLYELGTLATTDGAALSSLAQTFTDLTELRALVASEGRFYRTTTANGGEMVRPHPALGVIDATERRLLALLNAFGLTPIGRTRLETSDPTVPPTSTKREPTGTADDYF